ncbi:MAG TPA: hypothetical protein VGS57_15295 [Thermoanaerobaculia bacterium]|nr:hypothetical protein [Thermoanaerobaculia bacterium]
MAAPASAQFVLRDHEDLDFDRPEAWAMAWFAAVAFPTALGTEPLPPGAVELSLEGGYVPSLSEEQRTVGFLGEKPEDLNRTSVFGRPRVTIGLPANLTATASWAPPVDIGGVEPDVVSLALAGQFWQGERGRVGARLFGQRGTLRGDLTCPRDVAGVDDFEINPYGCEKPSRDEMSLRLVGAELSAATTLERWPSVSPYVSIARSRLHAEFQVDAQRSGFLDRTLLETDGTIWSGTLGVSVNAGRGARLAGEIFYAPLDVAGRAGKGKETDGLLNARVLLGYRIR